MSLPREIFKWIRKLPYPKYYSSGINYLRKYKLFSSNFLRYKKMQKIKRRYKKKRENDAWSPTNKN